MMVRALALITAAAVFACTSGSPDADVAIPVTVADVTLQLGSMDGDDATAFGRVSGLAADDDGRIFVADHQASDVRVFGPDGSHLFTFGRAGGGPGEMVNPCCMAWDPNGLLWLRDGTNRRYNAYRIGDRQAEFVEQRRMAHADVNYWAALSFASDGSLIDVGHRTDGSGEPHLVRFFLGPDGQSHPPEMVPSVDPAALSQHSVVRDTRYGPARMYLHQPYGPSQLVAYGPRGMWAHGVSSQYAFTAITGADTGRIARDAVGPELSERERALGRDALEAQAQRVGVRVGQLPFGIPDRKTPVRAIFYDAGGNLWVERNVPDGQPRSADVWSPDGQLLREIQWPSDVALTVPSWVGASSALGVQRDSLGVNYVVRLEY